MIKKVRLQFFAMTMGIIFTIFAVIVTAILVSMHFMDEMRTNQTLKQMMSDYELFGKVGGTSKDETELSDDSVRTCVIYIDRQSALFDITVNGGYFSNEKIDAIVVDVMENDREKGNIGNVYYLSKTKIESITVVATDRTIEKENFSRLLLTVLIAAVGGFLALSLVVWFLSYWVVKPIKDAFLRQQQFVADASHELKTPVTVISANVDVLEAEMGDNQWLKNIKNQTQRMSFLANDLLQLAKIDEVDATRAERRFFDLSKAVAEAVLPFEGVAFEEGRTMEISVAENIRLCGDENAVKQAAGILTDNAIKYSDRHGIIKISLKNTDSGPVLEVYNTGLGIKEEEKEKIFERFYRSDFSRNRDTGGSGLGLSILKNLADKNKWRIKVTGEEGCYALFSISF